MPALNHVITWDPKTNNWIRIDATVASRNWGGITVPAKQKVFVCELCKQFVILTRGDGKVTPYFKHNRAEEDKNCPEHSFGLNPVTYEPNDYSLPLKIELVQDGTPRFWLGLIAPSGFADKQRQCLSKENLTVTPVGLFGEKFSPIRYRLDRLLNRGITYVSIGSSPKETYLLGVTDEVRRCTHWPDKTTGVRRSGTLFDAVSGKRIPEDGDVVIGKEYWLLMADGRPDSGVKDILCEEVSLRGVAPWRMFKVRANRISQEAACFFLKYKLRLTESPVSLFPLWPMTVKRPYVIAYENPRLVFFSSGSDVANKAYPAYAAEMTPIANLNGTARLLEVRVLRHGLLISAGRTNVLKYAFVKQEKLPEFAPPAESDLLKLVDADGNSIDTNGLGAEPLSLPKDRIEVQPKYSSEFDIEVDGRLVERLQLRAQEATMVHLPKMCRCRLRVGRDELCCFEVRSGSLRAHRPQSSVDRLSLRRRLKAAERQTQSLVPPASVLKVRNLIGYYPEVNVKLRNGELPRAALSMNIRKK